jgi:glycosyltransferase involved in cell wall biosynthesis
LNEALSLMGRTNLKVMIVSAVFPPEPMVSAQTSDQLALELLTRGHSVHVLSPFPNRPRGKIFDGYRRTLFSTSKSTSESGRDFVLTRCWSFFSSESTMINRFAENISFGVTSGLRLLFAKRPDVVYSNSWAIFATGIISLVARLRRIPLVLSVQDVYPESLETQGRVGKRRLSYRLLRKCDQAILHSAREIVVISEGFRELFTSDRGIPPERLHVIPNWGREEVLQSDSRKALEFRLKLGIPEDAFVAVYAGNVGVASNAEMLVDVFAGLKNETRIYLVLAGDGSRLNLCREKIAQHGLDRVVIHSPWRPEETMPVLQMADVLLLPTKGAQSMHSIPSKLISYFLSARPVVAAVLPASDTAMAVRDNGAGWVVAPESVEAMEKAILGAFSTPSQTLDRMGSAGRTYALENLTRGANLPRVLRVVENAAR